MHHFAYEQVLLYIFVSFLYKFFPSPPSRPRLDFLVKLPRAAMRMLASSSDSATPKPFRSQTFPQTTFATWRLHNSDALTTHDFPDDTACISSAEPWVTAFLTVAFDVDKGQIVESCVPENVLTVFEKEAVCFTALPDSSALSSGHEDTFFTFRILSDTGGRLLSGHSLYRQAPDKLNPRGFFQKALVVITSAPCLSLPDVLLSSLASKAFTAGEEALFRAIEDIALWPDPRIPSDKNVIDVPFVDETITLHLPNAFLSSFAAPRAVKHTSIATKSRPFDSPTSITRTISIMDDLAGVGTPPLVRKLPISPPSPNPTVPPFHEVDIVKALAGVHDKIWVLWELVALGEPILVFAPTPSQCSAAVLAIIGLIHPFPFTGDWRPYFCIQDPSYILMLGCKEARKYLRHGGVYGVTSCHLADTLPFRHVLTLPGCESGGKPRRPGLQTDHRRQLYRSPQLLSSFPSLTGSQARDAIFDKITRPFLSPFDRYLEPHWEGRRTSEAPYALDPFGRYLNLLPLDGGLTAEKGLFRSGRGRSSAFYKRFVEGSVWKVWWESARAAAEKECVRQHRRDVIEACIRGTPASRDPHSRADLRARLSRELEDASPTDNVLRGRVRSMLAALEE